MTEEGLPEDEPAAERKMRFLFSLRSRGVTDARVPVSYTHLDVYKRQHVFHTVSNQLAAGQAVQHAVMTHGDAVIHRNGVEFLGHTTRRLNLARDHLPQVFQVNVARHELGERVDNSNCLLYTSRCV